MNFVIRTLRVKSIAIIFLTLLIASISCEDFTNIDSPRDQIISNTVFSDDEAALSAMRGLYSAMIETSTFSSGGLGSFTVIGSLSSDELVNYSSGSEHNQFYENSLLSTNEIVLGQLWSQPYKYIYYSNSILEGINASTALTENTKKQLEGEAKFIRAFCHFYLVNLFGDIPLVLSTDYRVNRNSSRVSKAEVYKQINVDLADAKNLLRADYSISNGERIRPNKWAATALLARVYLYQGDWINAERQASQVIENTTDYTLLSNLNEVFLKNSKEAIWQLLSISCCLNTYEGNTFIIESDPPLVALTQSLVGVFELNDARRTYWIGSFNSGTNAYYYPYKYKIKNGRNSVSEYSMVLRLAEQYLIRAEARSHLDNLAGALDDLNMIRRRANLPPISATSQSTMLDAIEQERRVELFTEWGHRWLDLKRTNRTDVVLSASKPNWKSTDALYPIPKNEMANDANLTPQNEGY